MMEVSLMVRHPGTFNASKQCIKYPDIPTGLMSLTGNLETIQCNATCGCGAVSQMLHEDSSLVSTVRSMGRIQWHLIMDALISY